MINTFMFLVRYTQTNINHLPYKTTHYYRIGGEALRFYSTTLHKFSFSVSYQIQSQ